LQKNVNVLFAMLTEFYKESSILVKGNYNKMYKWNYFLLFLETFFQLVNYKFQVLYT